MENKEWHIININDFYKVKISDQYNFNENEESVPLSDIEKVTESIYSKKRSGFVNYTISGSGFIEKNSRKRLKIHDNDYVKINIASHNIRRYPRSIFRPLLRHYDTCWTMVHILFILLTLIIIIEYVFR